MHLPFLLLGIASRPCSSAAEEAGHGAVLEKREGAACGGCPVDDVPDMLEPGVCADGDPKGF